MLKAMISFYFLQSPEGWDIKISTKGKKMWGQIIFKNLRYKIILGREDFPIYF